MAPFVREWSGEQAGGSQKLAELIAEVKQNPMSQAEKRVIPLVQKAHSLSQREAAGRAGDQGAAGRIVKP